MKAKRLFILIYIGLSLLNSGLRAQEVYLLKGGYELDISFSPDSMQVFTLRHEAMSRVIEEDPFLRYSGIDFNAYLVLDRWESQCDVCLYLYEKSSGKNLFKDKRYYESGYDMEHELLLYLDTDEKANPEGNLTLLDLHGLSEIHVDVSAFITEKVFPVYYWTEFRINKVDDGYVSITYEGEGPHVTRKYKRELIRTLNHK